MMSRKHVPEALWEEIAGLPLVERARVLATAAHEGQTDKAGAPYIDHPRRVAARTAARCEERGAFGYEADLLVAAAWLHDVVEDTSVGEAQLREAFPERTVDVVLAVTHRVGEPVEQWFGRIRAVPGAALVKNADVQDNTDPERTARLGKEDRQRLAAKYARYRELLGA